MKIDLARPEGAAMRAIRGFVVVVVPMGSTRGAHPLGRGTDNQFSLAHTSEEKFTDRAARCS